MTEETRSSTEHLSVVMTTTPDNDVTQITGTSTAASSTCRGAEFYFQCAVVFIGVVGTIANGLILYAFVASNQQKKKFLIFNQNALDFFSCLWLTINYIAKLGNIHLSGLSGYWLCMLIVGEYFHWIGITGSKINLVAVTVERYLIVVHSTWSKKWLRNRVIYSTIVFAWIASFAIITALVFPTSGVVNGVCYMLAFWESLVAHAAFSWGYFISLLAIPMLIMIYCYGHILVVIRRQARVMAGHNVSGSQNQTYEKIQANVSKTMFIVCAFFILFNLPNELIFLLTTVNENLRISDYSYHGTIFLVFLYISMNPFVYATKLDPVKRVLLDLIPCKKNSGQAGNISLPPAGVRHNGHNQNVVAA